MPISCPYKTTLIPWYSESLSGRNAEIPLDPPFEKGEGFTKTYFKNTKPAYPTG